MRSRQGSLAAMVAAVAIAGLAPGAAADTPAPGNAAFQGNAYGTYAFVGQAIVAGQTSPVGIGCLTPANTSTQNSLVTVDVPNVISAGVIHTTAKTFAGGGTVGDSTTSDISDINLLGGLIQVGVLNAASTTTATASGISTSADGTSLAGLVVNGQKFAVTPSPNTTIPLPGIGRVVLNEQIQTPGPGSAQFTVNLVHVYVTLTNSLGLTPGTEVIIGHATSGLTLPTSGTTRIGGDAYSTSINVAGLVNDPPTWGVGLAVGQGCVPADGSDTNGATALDIPGLLTAGTLANTADGTTDPSGANLAGTTTSTVQNVSLLGGLVKAALVEGVASAKVTPAGATFSDAGSRVVGLTVAGQEFDGDVPPNTRIPLGLVTVWLHRVIQTPTGIDVRMIEVTTDSANPPSANPPIDVQVAVAQTRVQ